MASQTILPEPPAPTSKSHLDWNSSNTDTTGIVKCPCNSLEDKETIECSNCSTWQHVNCFYLGLEGLYEVLNFEDVYHLCADCDLRPEEERGNVFPEKIVERKRQGPGYMYKVKWIGFLEEKNSWVTGDQIPSKLIDRFQEDISEATTSTDLSEAANDEQYRHSITLSAMNQEDEGRELLPTSTNLSPLQVHRSYEDVPAVEPATYNLLDRGRSSQLDQDIFDEVNYRLSVSLKELLVDSADLSYLDSDYGEEGFPLVFDHGSPIDRWQQFHCTQTGTSQDTDVSTTEAHRIGIKFVYADVPDKPSSGLFTGFAWLLIELKNDRWSLSFEKVVLALDDSGSSSYWEGREEVQELINLTRLCQLLQRLADGIETKLCPVNGRCEANIVHSFTLPKFSFAKLEEGAEFDELSPLDVLGRLVCAP